MKTGFRGTFVISWSQTELDGLKSAPLQDLETGVVWSWNGDAVRVDGPTELLRLDAAMGEASIRKRAAQMVHRLVGAAVDTNLRPEDIQFDEEMPDDSFVVTDGVTSYTVTLIKVEGGKPLLMFVDSLPPKQVPLWIVHHTLQQGDATQSGDAMGGVICFTPCTRIATPQGPRLVEELRQGDAVWTKDNGAQEIAWTGSRRMTGARLFAMPHLRPIRIRPGALGIGRPEEELIVSPHHRMVVQGRAARALFNTPEVLVAAQDLVNGASVVVDSTLREVTYVHILLPKHEVVWANGLETESFHPASAELSSLNELDRLRLLALLPELENDPCRCSEFVRRNLSKSEAAILQHEAA